MIQPEQQGNSVQKIVIQHPYFAGMVLEGRTWKTMQDFYEKLVNDCFPCEPLLDLVKAITASPYASLLHGTASHTDLLVCGYSPFEVNREMVRIEYLSQGKQFLFTYREHPWSGIRPSWRKICSADESKRVFERLIIHTLKWVPQEFRRARAREYEQAGFSQAFEDLVPSDQWNPCK